ncbi:hypothetical protein CIHG_02570 [Coccidioides immitis H538.4]|uniref:Uncharacterized protein n=1 Tax=Coccidioides immitis H538.4 TaxID=396776 RepID=A0A0J8RIW9_COCIT|nr:hypothetical protein CIHG_02570 [Coccidioides immitis H538.4]
MRYDGLRCCRLRLLAKKAVRLDKQPKPWAPRKISGPELQVNRQTPALPTSDSWKTKAGFSLSLYNNPSGAQAVINLFFNYYYYYYYYYYFYYFLSGLSSYFQLLLFSQRQTTLRLTTLNSYLFNSARHPALKAPLSRLSSSSSPFLSLLSLLAKMYSCVNYPRGCRGRVNVQGAKCSTCIASNLRRPGSSSPFSSALRSHKTYKRSWDVQESK